MLHRANQRAFDDLRLQNAKDSAAAETDLAELRGRIQMKSFETEQVSGACDARMGDLRQVKLENEMLHEKLRVLKVCVTRVHVG